MSTTAELLCEIEQDRFITHLGTLQRTYPPGTQFNLFEHLGYGCEFQISTWDANRCSMRWGCSVETYRDLLEQLLTKYCEYFRLHQREKCLRTLIESEIVRMVKAKIGTMLRVKYRQPTDRKVTDMIREYIKQVPEGQKAIRVVIGGKGT